MKLWLLMVMIGAFFTVQESYAGPTGVVTGRACKQRVKKLGRSSCSTCCTQNIKKGSPAQNAADSNRCIQWCIYTLPKDPTVRQTVLDQMTSESKTGTPEDQAAAQAIALDVINWTPKDNNDSIWDNITW